MRTYSQIAEVAQARVPEFSALCKDITYEEKGVLYSEILFMLVCMGEPPARILESGRARGQSTLLLARALPKSEILSVEYNPNSPDVLVAEERLRPYGNASLLFGDARKVLPTLLDKEAVAIIDGPKMFRAVRLALRLLASGRVRQVYIHDVNVETPERAFLLKFLPECMYSDNREVAEVTHVLDSHAADRLPENRKLTGFTGPFGYGFGLACIPYSETRNYRYLVVMAGLYDLVGRIRKKLRL